MIELHHAKKSQLQVLEDIPVLQFENASALSLYFSKMAENLQDDVVYLLAFCDGDDCGNLMYEANSTIVVVSHDFHFICCNLDYARMYRQPKKLFLQEYENYESALAVQKGMMEPHELCY